MSKNADGFVVGDGPADDISEAAEVGDVDVSEAAAAVRVGLWISAARCVLTYVVAPVVGALGVVLGPLGVALQVAGAITATAGARRLWRLGHRMRGPYVVVALVVDLVTVVVLAEAAIRLVAMWR